MKPMVSSAHTARTRAPVAISLSAAAATQWIIGTSAPSSFIIAHSNGGLLAKALLTELKNRNIENKVDRVIFIGTPQLGTPKAIGTILHGYDQTDSLGGIVTNAHTAREVINNMPGAYGLLPSEGYFMNSTEPVVSFENSS